MLSKYFGLYELVHPLIYRQLMKAGLAIPTMTKSNNRIFKEKVNQRTRMMFHPELIKDINLIREFYTCPIIVNDWHKNAKICRALINENVTNNEFLSIVQEENLLGKCSINRGLRLLFPEIGSSTSTHVFGHGIDFLISNIEGTIDAYTKESKRILRKKLVSAKRFEIGITWIHMDYLGRGEPVLFSP